MKVTMASERLLRTVVDEGLEHFICDDGKGIYAVRKDEVKIVREWVDETEQRDGLTAMALLARSDYRLVRHDVNELHNKCKAYAYLLERKKA